MDYGKFKYQEQKRQHEQKLKQKQVQVKEVKFRPGTDENDYQIKLRNMTRFLQEEDKVKVTLRFRGREMAHQEIACARLSESGLIFRILRWLNRCPRWKSSDGDDSDAEQEEVVSAVCRCSTNKWYQVKSVPVGKHLPPCL